jgi:Bacterial mobilisation protein (MobC)
MTDSPQPKPKSRSGSQTRQKPVMVTTAYSPEEFAALDEAASRAGLTRASFQRVQTLADPKTRSTRRAPVDRELLAKVLGQLGKIGGNLNQIAKAANLDQMERADLGAALVEIRAVAVVAMEAMGRKP